MSSGPFSYASLFLSEKCALALLLVPTQVVPPLVTIGFQ